MSALGWATAVLAGTTAVFGLMCLVLWLSVVQVLDENDRLRRWLRELTDVRP